MVAFKTEMAKLKDTILDTAALQPWSLVCADNATMPGCVTSRPAAWRGRVLCCLLEEGRPRPANTLQPVRNNSRGQGGSRCVWPCWQTMCDNSAASDRPLIGSDSSSLHESEREETTISQLSVTASSAGNLRPWGSLRVDTPSSGLPLQLFSLLAAFQETQVSLCCPLSSHSLL